MKVLHIITSLGSGGTEGMLYRLIQESSDTVEHSILCIKKGGKYESFFNEAGIDVLVLNLGFPSFFKAIINLFKFSLKKKKQGYQIITSWLYHADFMAWFIKLFFGFRGLAWNIRSSHLQRQKISINNIFYLKFLSVLSNIIVNKIISCSRSAIEIHKKIGYRDIFTYIPNGYFIDKNKKFIKDYKNYEGIFRICMIARWHPQKDFETIFQALDLFKIYNIPFHFTIAGNNTDSKNLELFALLKKYSLENFCSMLGEVDDVDTIYKKSHVNVLSSSFGETFPNVLSESMLNFTPCISTNVGDSQEILSKVGFIVPIGDFRAISDALKEVHDMLTQHNDIYLEYCLEGYNKVYLNYNINHVSKIYQDLWKSLIINE